MSRAHLGVLGAAAVEYARKGLYVFPLSPSSKLPYRGSHGLLAATNDPDRAQHTWKTLVNANIGINLGLSGLLVIDVDPRNGGLFSVEDLNQEFGPQVLREAPTVRTPSSGKHYYFKNTPDDSIKTTHKLLGPGIDVLAHGAYVVAPCSSIGQDEYLWEYGDEDLAPLRVPQALAERLKPRALKPNTTPTIIAVGSRNPTLASLGGRLRRIGLSEEEIYATLTRVNADRCCPPLDSGEVSKIARSMSHYRPAFDALQHYSDWLPQLRTEPQLKVAFRLAALAARLNGSCSPAAAVLMKSTGLARSTVFKALSDLELAGYFFRHRRGVNAPTYYLQPYK